MFTKRAAFYMSLSTVLFLIITAACGAAPKAAATEAPAVAPPSNYQPEMPVAATGAPAFEVRDLLGGGP